MEHAMRFANTALCVIFLAASGCGSGKLAECKGDLARCRSQVNECNSKAEEIEKTGSADSESSKHLSSLGACRIELEKQLKACRIADPPCDIVQKLAFHENFTDCSDSAWSVAEDSSDEEVIDVIDGLVELNGGSRWTLKGPRGSGSSTVE
jgi:hypothetical protein